MARAACWLSLACCVLAGARGECPPCPAPPSDLCQAISPLSPTECAYEIGDADENLIVTKDASSFSLKCPMGISLDDPALPRFTDPVWVPKVVLIDCEVGSEPLASVLARLGLGAPDGLSLHSTPYGLLQADTFLGLEALQTLHIAANPSNWKTLDAEPTVFRPLTNLTKLNLSYVNITPEVFENINAPLKDLALFSCGLETLDLRHVCSMPVESLRVSDDALMAIEDANCSLHTLTLYAKNLPRVPSSASSGVIELRLKVKELRVGNCSSIETLSVYSEAVELPAGWLVGCGRLTRLTVNLKQLTTLKRGALRGASHLTHLEISAKLLKVIESGIFMDTRKIRVLSLTRNSLKTLPSDIFAPLTALDSLDMSDSHLSAPALSALSGLRSLRRLLLARVPLGDLCPPIGYEVYGKQLSALAGLSQLEELSLPRSGARRVCADWRRLPALRVLDLQHNNITLLQWEDLQWGEGQAVTVRLEGNELAAVDVTRPQLQAALTRAITPTTVKFIFNKLIVRCDCNFYWFKRALEKRVAGVAVEGLRCAAPGPGGENDPEDSALFELVKAEDMVCSIDVNCPTNCTCVSSLHDDETDDTAILVECWGKLSSWPDLSLVAAKYEGTPIHLRANNTGLTSFPTSMPKSVTKVDVRNNGLATANESVAKMLFEGGRRLWLAGNPLVCTCSQELLRQMQIHISQVGDADVSRCSNGRWVREAVSVWCGAGAGAGGAWWAAGGAAGALAAAAGVLAALRRALRLRLKAFLLARGLCLRWTRPDDNDRCKYDAFLSFSHEDLAVAEEIAAQLEAGPAPLRLCLHYRDWAPGAWIPAQIARSVAESRRTIILLSENFLRSSWARAEFREAYARAVRETSVRLIVVVLGHAPPTGLDSEMRHYVTNNTYVRWGEPAFWEKLRVALPEPRPPPPATPRPAPTSPRETNTTSSSPPQNPPEVVVTSPQVVVIPEPAPTPPTPIIKFGHFDFPTPTKPLKHETSACA